MRAFVVDEPRTGALRALNYAPAVERIRRAGSSSARPLREIVKEFGPAYGTVLLYGRAILADDRLVGKYVGPDSMTLIFEAPADDFSLFAYAWLASPTGVQAIRSASYGTKILRFRADLLTSLPVPVPTRAIVARVASLIRTCTTQRARYRDEMTKAREVVAKIVPTTGAVSDGKSQIKYVLWTDALPSIRAWNFASMGDRLRDLRRHWGTTLGDWLQPGGLFKGGRIARIPCVAPHGVDLLSQRDVFAIRPIPRRIQSPNPPLSVAANYLLVASRGQMNEGALFGRVERGAHTPSDAAITEDVMRLIPREGLESALFAFLSSGLGLELLRSTAYGTSIPGMREDLLVSLPTPPTTGAWLKKAAAHCDNATDARVQAYVAESEAFRIIEEEVLPQWLA